MDKQLIIGIDEVGRGAWAGPLAVGAVALTPYAASMIAGLADSKTLSAKRRRELAALVRLHAPWVGIGWVSAASIDRLGMSAALKLAARRATASHPEAREIIIDGTIKLIEGPNVSTLKKADQLIPAVSAAAIVAKVARDDYMMRLHGLMPEYGFDGHVGYGTAQHRQQIDIHGVSSIHRKSFAPMKDLLADDASGAHAETTNGASADSPVGAEAEGTAGVWLESQGYSVVQYNWRSRQCEIDIIVQKDRVIYAVEVKYRKTDTAGSGAEYATVRKRQQMAFAAQTWAHVHGWKGELRLAVIELGGELLRVNRFETDIDAGGAHRVRTRLFGR